MGSGPPPPLGYRNPVTPPLVPSLQRMRSKQGLTGMSDTLFHARTSRVQTFHKELCKNQKIIDW